MRSASLRPAAAMKFAIASCPKISPAMSRARRQALSGWEPTRGASRAHSDGHVAVPVGSAAITPWVVNSRSSRAVRSLVPGLARSMSAADARSALRRCANSSTISSCTATRAEASGCSRSAAPRSAWACRATACSSRQRSWAAISCRTLWSSGTSIVAGDASEPSASQARPSSEAPGFGVVTVAVAGGRASGSRNWAANAWISA